VDLYLRGANVAIISKQAIPRSISDTVPRQRKEKSSPLKAEGMRTEDKNGDRHKYILN
jgi:hypothetical protein